jgi:hypothetical protein
MKTSIINKLLLPVAVTAVSFSLNAQQKKMNVLFIAVDDILTDWLKTVWYLQMHIANSH